MIGGLRDAELPGTTAPARINRKWEWSHGLISEKHFTRGRPAAALELVLSVYAQPGWWPREFLLLKGSREDPRNLGCL
jgi:hypothetical protein